MPETTIEWVLVLKRGVIKRTGLAQIPDKISGAVCALALSLVVVGVWLALGSLGGILCLLLCLPFLLAILAEEFNFKYLKKAADVFRKPVDELPAIGEGVYAGLLGVAGVLGAAALLSKVLRLPTGYATLIMLFLLPIYWMMIFFPVLIVGVSGWKTLEEYFDRFKDNIVVFCMGAGMSFLVTLAALLFGHVVRPELWVPQTVQMLFSNVMCDGFTLVATFWFLRWAVAKRPLLRIPVAILGDIVVAAVLACFSLYFGLVFTERALSVRQVLYVLIGKAPSGAGLEFGPCFWAMHTTFIPTLLYLVLIGVCWLAKAMLTAAEKFTKKALGHDKPLGLTAALFAIFFAVFTAASMAMGSGEQWRDKQVKAEQGPHKVVEVNDVDRQ